MPPSPHRLALAITLLAGSGFVEAALSPSKTVQIDTPTTTGQTLGGSDSLTTSASGSITTSGVAVNLKDGTSAAGVVITNAGKLISTGGRGIDSSGSLTGARNYSIYNLAGGVIQGANDALRINSNFASGSLLIDNSGTIRSATGQGLDLDSIRSSNVTTTIINRAGGMKTGGNASITNYGEISTGDTFSRDDKFDGVDIDSATGVTVTNYGSVIGRNGSGFGSDGDGTVINHGTITGAYSGLQPDGDGDGVDIDHIAHIENYGIIQGVGAGGVDKNGFANGSEGIALGGGYVYNAKGALVSGANNAVLVGRRQRRPRRCRHVPGKPRHHPGTRGFRREVRRQLCRHRDQRRHHQRQQRPGAGSGWR